MYDDIPSIYIPIMFLNTRLYACSKLACIKYSWKYLTMKSVKMWHFGNKTGCLWPHMRFACHERPLTLRTSESLINGLNAKILLLDGNG